MRRIPLSIKGLVLAPVIILIIFAFKSLCSETGSVCLADQFSTAIFLPLLVVYKFFGSSAVIAGQEFLLVIIYWAIIGFLLGLILDLCTRQSPYSPSQRPPL